MLISGIVWERPSFYSSPSISRSLDAGLEMAGLTKDDIDTFDFYSSVSLSTSRWDILTVLQLFSYCSETCMSASRTVFDQLAKADHSPGWIDIFWRRRE
jgi:hypothetical protein